MKSDSERWDARYDSHELTDAIKPDSILTNHQSILPGKGKVLDVAAGKCDNALYLAIRGYDSFAIDASHIALRLGKYKAAKQSLNLNCLVADLDAYPLPVNHFDVVVVIRYLNRGLTEAVKQTLKLGGLMFFKTFNKNILEEKPSFPSDYVLENGELTSWFRGWKCADTNDGLSVEATQSYWVGTKS
jgi:SAM-dependent methyltransferase